MGLRLAPDARPSWPDVAAGLSIAGLLLPEAVAYSGIANLPPQAGIIGLVAGLACYGLIGRSRFAIVSATSSSAAVLSAVTAALATGDAGLRITMASGLVLLTGLYFLMAGLARLGSITDFIAKPVLRGFAFGLALVIVLHQCAGIVGIRPTAGDALNYTLELLRATARWNLPAAAVGVAALLLLWMATRIPRLPAGLLVIALGIVASRWLDLGAHGVSMVGTIRLDLGAPRLPALDRAAWLRLAEYGIALALVLYSESYGSIRSFALRHGDAVRPNRDLIALGASNLLSALFLGMPVGAGFSATAANEAAGSRSRYAGIVALAVLLALILLVLPFIAMTPEPVLGAIVINAVAHSLRAGAFRPYFEWHRDRLLAVASVVAVLWLGVLDGLLAAIAISLIMMLRRISASTVAVLGRLGAGHDFVDIANHPEARPVDGVLVLRPDEPLFFANAERILADARHRIERTDAHTIAVVISLEESFDLDGSTIEALLDFMDWARDRGKRVSLARLKHPVHELLRRVTPVGPAAPILTGLSVDDAVAMALEAGAGSLKR